MFNKIIFYVVLSCFPILLIGQQKKAIEKEKLLDIFETINHQNLYFEADDMNTSSMGTNFISSAPNTFHLINDSIFVDLPFFGRAYQVNFKNEGGFHFQGPLKRFHKKLNRRKTLIILSLETKSNSDLYKINVFITTSDYSTLSITSNSRETIQYSGKIRLEASTNESLKN